MATERNITLDDQFTIGDAETIDGAVTDAQNQPRDITGWAILFTLKSGVDDASVLLEKTVGDGITITDGPGGLYEIAFTAAETAALKSREYAYSVRRTDPNAEELLTWGTLEPLKVA